MLYDIRIYIRNKKRWRVAPKRWRVAPETKNIQGFYKIYQQHKRYK